MERSIFIGLSAPDRAYHDRWVVVDLATMLLEGSADDPEVGIFTNGQPDQNCHIFRVATDESAGAIERVDPETTLEGVSEGQFFVEADEGWEEGSLIRGHARVVDF